MMKHSISMVSIEYLASTAESYPESIYKTFQLIHNSKNLQKDHFLEHPKENGRQSKFDTNAAHDYNLTLAKRANELQDSCGNPDMFDSPKIEWVQLLVSQVLLSFDRQKEEKLDAQRPFHHWYAICVSTMDNVK